MLYAGQAGQGLEGVILEDSGFLVTSSEFLLLLYLGLWRSRLRAATIQLLNKKHGGHSKPRLWRSCPSPESVLPPLVIVKRQFCDYGSQPKACEHLRDQQIMKTPKEQFAKETWQGIFFLLLRFVHAVSSPADSYVK